MAVQPSNCDFSLIFSEPIFTRVPFPTYKLKELPFITDQLFELTTRAVREIEGLPKAWLSFSQLPVYLFVALELVLLIAVYFYAILMVFFWGFLLLFLLYIHQRKRFSLAVIKKAKVILKESFEQSAGMHSFEIELSSKSFLKLFHFAIFKIHIKTSILEAIRASKGKENSIEATKVDKEGTPSVKNYRVDIEKIKHYDSESERSDCKIKLTSSREKKSVTIKIQPEKAKSSGSFNELAVVAVSRLRIDEQKSFQPSTVDNMDDMRSSHLSRFTLKNETDVSKSREDFKPKPKEIVRFLSNEQKN